MTSHFSVRSLLHKSTLTILGIAVAAVAATIVNADVVISDQPFQENAATDIETTIHTTGPYQPGLTVDTSSGDLMMSNTNQDLTASLRGGSGGPYIPTEPIRIIDGSRALTTAFYSGGGPNPRPYFGGTSSIPEPSSLALLGFGAAGLMTWRRRRSA